MRYDSGTPPNLIAPSVGRSRPSRVLASVGFPHPDSPPSAPISPGAMFRFTPSTAAASVRRPRPAKTTRTSAAARMGSVIDCRLARCQLLIIRNEWNPRLAPGSLEYPDAGRLTVLPGRPERDVAGRALLLRHRAPGVEAAAARQLRRVG